MFAPTSAHCWTLKAFTDVIPGLWSYDVIQKIYPSTNMLFDRAFWKFFKYWLMLGKDSLELSKQKSLLVRYSDELLLQMIEDGIDPKAFRFN